MPRPDDEQPRGGDAPRDSELRDSRPETSSPVGELARMEPREPIMEGERTSSCDDSARGNRLNVFHAGWM